MVACLWYFIVGNQGYFGGINGITDLKTLKGWDIRTEDAHYILYYLCCVLLLLCILVSRYILSTRLGRVLIAQRDKEMRVRFSGYNITSFRIFIFCFAAVVSSIGGAMFTLQVGFMSPNLIGIVPSIDMVIFTAVGGKRVFWSSVRCSCGKRCQNGVFRSLCCSVAVFLRSDFHSDRALFTQGACRIYSDRVKSWIDKFVQKSKSSDSLALGRHN